MAIAPGIWNVFPSRMSCATARVDDQHFAHQPPPATVGHLEQILRHHAAQVLGEGVPHLVLGLGGEHVENAMDGLMRAAGAERAEDEVPGLGGLDGQRDRLAVPHLADHDHVGILPKRRAQPVVEGAHVAPHLALHHERHAARVHELDRLLEGYDREVAGLVQTLHERGQRRGLAGPGAAGDQHQPRVERGELGDDRRQPEIVEIGNLDRE